jgi:hypothetical protein
MVSAMALVTGAGAEVIKRLLNFGDLHHTLHTARRRVVTPVLNSLLKYSHPRLFGGIGTLPSLASPQICPNTPGLLGRFGRLEIAPIALKNPSARVIQHAVKNPEVGLNVVARRVGLAKIL